MLNLFLGLSLTNALHHIVENGFQGFEVNSKVPIQEFSLVTKWYLVCSTLSMENVMDMITQKVFD